MANVHILWAYRPESMHCVIPNILLLQTESNTIIWKALQSFLEARVVQRGSETESRAMGPFPFKTQVTITLFWEKLRNKFSYNRKHSLKVWVGEILIFCKYIKRECNFYLNSMFSPFQIPRWLRLNLMPSMTTYESQGH